MIGATVGSYRIVSRLGVGGMGTVRRAEHVLIGKQAAIKVLRDELCLNEEAVNRFLNGGARGVILPQVTFGIAVRIAVMAMLGGGNA